jgi:hypothetical protein
MGYQQLFSVTSSHQLLNEMESMEYLPGASNCWQQIFYFAEETLGEKGESLE